MGSRAIVRCHRESGEERWSFSFPGADAQRDAWHASQSVEDRGRHVKMSGVGMAGMAGADRWQRMSLQVQSVHLFEGLDLWEKGKCGQEAGGPPRGKHEGVLDRQQKINHMQRACFADLQTAPPSAPRGHKARGGGG
jgi:hypothetical protein